MPRYALTLSYDGTLYGGWQIQPNAPSIQNALQEALTICLQQKIHVTGSGRTDAGVHALGQVAHFDTKTSLDIRKTFFSLNALLPKDIRVLSLIVVEEDFHARYSSIKKTYHYHLHTDSVENPFTRLYSWHIPYPIEPDLLKKAASIFIGTHDFSSFTNEQHKGAAGKNSIRTIYQIDLIPKEKGLLLSFEGNGFLYKMVRNITGTLVAVASGKLPIQKVEEILHAKNRQKAPAGAPALGLFLAKVDYKSSLKEENT